MYLIVGLGNPGPKYAQHRHNVGFQIVDLLAARHGLTFSKSQHQAQLASGQLAGEKVLLAKPQSYMNESGQPVRALLDYYKVPPDRLLVVVDHLDLDFGMLRLRPQGGAGGQNGMKSIIQHLGTQDFARLRVGIGRPPGRMDPAAYVLQNFSAEQEAEMQLLRQEAADAIELWLREGVHAAMNQYN